MKSETVRIRTFFFCLTVLLCRAWERLWNAGIWAEDGKVYLQNALNQGWSSLLEPHTGYYHTLGRLVTLVALYFPLALFPYLIAAFCFILYAWVVSVFSEKTYRTLVPSDAARVFISTGFCLIPGGYEVVGNLCNSHRILAPYVMFLGMRAVQDRISIKQIVMTFISAGTAGEVFVFLPMFVYRAWKRWKIENRISFITPEILICLILLVWFVLDFRARETFPDYVLNLRDVAVATVASFTSSVLLEPVVGFRIMRHLWGFGSPFWILCGVLSFFLFRDMWRSRHSDRVLLYLGSWACFGVLGLTWMVRENTVDLFLGFAQGMPWWDMREGYSLSFAAYLIWGTFFGKISKAAGIAYVLFYFIVSPILKIPALGDTGYWRETASQLEKSIKTGCPKEVLVKFFPQTLDHWWQFTYVSPKECALK